MIKGGEGQEGRRRMGEESGGWPERGRRKIPKGRKKNWFAKMTTGKKK